MSCFAGEIHIVKKARKDHYCNWCGQPIRAGESYKHWLWYDDGRRDTVKTHPECLEYLEKQERDYEGYVGIDGDGHRPERTKES